MRILVLLALLATPFAPLAVPAGPSELQAQAGFLFRDLYVKGANPDGRFICAEWCGILESCC